MTARRDTASRFQSPTSCASRIASTRSACTTSKAAGPARTPEISSSSPKRSTAPSRTRSLAAFGSTRRKDVGAAADDQVQLLIAAETPVVTIFGKTSPLHVREVLQTTLDENLAMIADTVRFLKAHGKFVVYDAEHCFDGFKEDTPYALATLHAAEKAGADIVTLCDTNGGSLPADIAAITRLVRGELRARIGIHTHDDIGLGVANALAAIEAGATHVQGTINGYGERTGNCNMTSVIPILHFKLNRRGVPAESLPLLTELSQFVDETANLRPNPRLPWVGASAFSHKGGTHVNAVAKVLSSYEHVNPASVGNTRHVLISDLAGRSNIVMKARELGFDLTNDAHLRTLLTAIKEIGASRLRVRGGRRLADPADPPRAVQGAAAVHRRRVPRVDAVGGRHVGVRGDGQGARRRPAGAHGRRRRRPGQCARRRAARGARHASIRICSRSA